MIIDIKIYNVEKPQTLSIYIFIVRVASRRFSNKDIPTLGLSTEPKTVLNSQFFTLSEIIKK